jgi:hypothetical protein
MADLLRKLAREDMSTPKIDKDVPIPEWGKVKLTYPFNEMDVGDSFVVPKEKGSSMRNCAFHYSRRWGKEFVTRKVKNGLRVWRTK